MKRKTPKIEWEAKTETVDDIQYSYVAKAVTYARDCNVLITFPKSNHTLNLFETHIKSDAVVFGYTSLEGKQKEFRFPLTGFNEKYLEQFIV